MEYKKITTSERKCNSCGFATFSLHVLYRHKLRCQGKLLGFPQKCGYCKRKFTFPFARRQHLKTCVKRNKKLSKLLFKGKNKKLTNGFISSKKSFKEKKPSTIVCPVCMKFFDSRTLYAAHEKRGNCGQQKEVKKKSASARKSFQKTPSKYKQSKYSSESSDSDSSLVSDNLLSDIVERNRKFIKSSRGYSCIRCKKAYPAKVSLLKHLDSNYKCALAHFEQDFFQKKFAKARKSVHHVVARKSISHSYRNSHQLNKSISKFGASARKSLPNSFHKQQFKPHNVKQSSVKTVNQCPVCHDKFPDSFTFYQHQKKYHHWGKATKTVSLSCKCPFCLKEFFSVRARNAHIHNHADQADYKIEAFIKSTTCDICSQVFVSEALKLQHLKIEHSRKQNFAISTDSTDILINDDYKYVSLPLAIKQQLKQYPCECPICNEKFTSPAFRNNHFEEIHLNSEIPCQFCPIKFSYEELVDDHMKKFHYDQFKYECFICKDKFPSVSYVVAHVKKLHPAHDPKNKQQSAIKSFNQQNSRVFETVQRKESQEKDQGYFCDICNLTFPKLQFLKRHEQSKEHCDTLVKNLDAVHESLSNLPPSPSPLLPKTVATPEYIYCSECFEEFTTLKEFVPHRLSHFGEKEKYMEISEDNTYTCEICGDVSDNHSKVQIHLFWHLQIESSTKEKKLPDISKSNSTISGRSSGQHVAKKSFGKQTQETHQEVVIGGIKKHLFTCDSCKIGFTNQTHYNLHVRRFCKMKNNPLSNNSNDVVITEPSKSSSALLNPKSNKPEKSEILSVEIMLCHQCCSIFNKSIKHIHDEICSKCKRSHLEPSANVIGFKTSIKLKKAVAACLKCDFLFLTSQKFVEHMLSIHSLPKENPVNNENPEIKEKENLMNERKKILVTDEKEVLVNDEKQILLNKEEKEIPIKEEKEVPVNDEKEILLDKEEIPMNEENKININDENEIAINDENTLVLGGDFVIHCTTCNFIFFSTDTLSEHEKTCTKFSYSNSRLENYTPEFKAALEENGIVSSCLNCDLAFNNAQDLTEHLEFHQKNVTSTEQGDSEVMVLDEPSIKDEKIDVSEAVSENTAIPAPEVLKNTQSSQDVSGILPNAQIDSLVKSKDTSLVPTDAPSDSLPSKMVEDIDSLRKNFSQLLSILVADPDLMQQLGYGELLVDEVLINVLQTMEQTPVLKDGKTTDLECLRKNILILLDFCLEEQIMDLIREGKTSTDDIVVEALKIFGGESSMSMVALE